MFRFIFFLFFLFILLLFLMGFSVIRTFKNILFGGGNKKKAQQNRQRSRTGNTYNQQSRTEHTNHSSPKKKIISKDEGEYVDYEEIKN